MESLVTRVNQNVGQADVSGGVSVVCWHRTTVKMFYGNLLQFVKKSNLVTRSNSVTLLVE